MKKTLTLLTLIGSIIAVHGEQYELKAFKTLTEKADGTKVTNTFYVKVKSNQPSWVVPEKPGVDVNVEDITDNGIRVIQTRPLHYNSAHDVIKDEYFIYTSRGYLSDKNYTITNKLTETNTYRYTTVLGNRRVIRAFVMEK